MPHSAKEMLAHIHEVAPMPEAAMRVMTLAGREDTTLRQLVEAVGLDAAITAEVLRLASTAAYRRPNTEINLSRAVWAIGAHAVRDVAAALGMLAAFRSESEVALHLNEQAFLAGSIATCVARDVKGPATTEAFLSGLLSPVGSMACAAVDGEYGALFQAAPSEADREAMETARYGTTARAIGGELLRHNRLPDRLAEAVASDGEGALLGRITAFARAAAEALVQLTRRPTAAPNDGDGGADALAARLGELAARYGLDAFFTDERLAEVVLEAGVHTETKLREGLRAS